MRPLVSIPNTRGELQRTYQLPPYQRPGPADFCLADEAQYMSMVVAQFGLNQICCPQGRKPYPQRPWIAMPSEGRRFKPIGILPIPAGPPLNTVYNVVPPGQTSLLTVPLGYDGIITDMVCELTAPGSQSTGFVEGSGDVIWRLNIQGRFARDFGNIITTLGSLVYPSPVPRGGIRVWSGNVVNFEVVFGNNAQTTLNPAATVICSVTGWVYPR
jgi:hypothetical protein